MGSRESLKTLYTSDEYQYANVTAERFHSIFGPVLTHKGLSHVQNVFLFLIAARFLPWQ